MYHLVPQNTDSEDEGKKFQDEPGTPLNGTNNIVEDYGVDAVPGDEDVEKGEKSYRFGDDPQRTKKTAGLLCCCILILVIIGVVVGVVLGKDDEEPSKPRGTSAPVPAPVPLPATTAPVRPPTPPPTTAALESTLGEFSILATADTIVYLEGGVEDGPFGGEKTLLVQNNVSGAVTMALVGFNIPDLPDPELLVALSPKAVLILTIFDDANSSVLENVTLDTLRFPSYPGDVEQLTSNISSEIAGVNRTMGPSFDISAEMTEVSVDISSLFFEESQANDLRRLQEVNNTQFLIGLVISDSGIVRFYSSESEFPPKLDIILYNSTNDCPICGTGNNVTNPDGELSLPTIGNVTCAFLEGIAMTGAITESNCALLQPVVSRTCCGDGADIFVCNLCRDGGNITNPSTIVSILGQAENTCAGYLGLAEMGSIPEILCPALQNVTDEVCCEIGL